MATLATPSHVLSVRPAFIVRQGRTASTNATLIRFLRPGPPCIRSVNALRAFTVLLVDCAQPVNSIITAPARANISSVRRIRSRLQIRHARVSRIVNVRPASTDPVETQVIRFRRRNQMHLTMHALNAQQDMLVREVRVLQQCALLDGMLSEDQARAYCARLDSRQLLLLMLART